MRTIWKTPIEITDHQEIELPQGAEPLSCQFQIDQLCVWWLVDTDLKKESRALHIVGTGHPISADEVNLQRFIGTAQLDGLAWHVFA